MTYTYECTQCRQRHDREGSMYAVTRTTTCPACDGVATLVITGGSGFVLRGRGWAADGYSTPAPGSIPK